LGQAGILPSPGRVSSVAIVTWTGATPGCGGGSVPATVVGGVGGGVVATLVVLGRRATVRGTVAPVVAGAVGGAAVGGGLAVVAGTSVVGTWARTGQAPADRPAMKVAHTTTAAAVLGFGWRRCNYAAPMQHRSLGRTGVAVSPLCLGAMMFGAWGNPDHDDCVRIIHAALGAGINFIDTADVYSAGESEQIVGKALSGGRRDDVVLATKFHAPMGDDPNQRGNSRRWIIRECEASLRRLGTDWIDLYQVHRPDPACDIDETLAALSDLVHQGKVRYLGSSTFPASAIVEGQWTAERRGRERFVCEQPPYSILVRGIEADVLPTCERYAMGVIPWSPLAGGWLSGKYRKGAAAPKGGRAARIPQRYDATLPENQRKLDVVEELVSLADEAGVSLVQLAIAFVLEHPAVTAAIIGPRTMEHLEGQLGAAELVLDEKILDRIDELVQPGTDLNVADAGWTPPALADAALRRRRATRA